MKKKLLTLLLLVNCYGAVTAQAFKENQKYVNLGIGLGTPYFGSGYSTALPVNPTFTYEQAVTENISAGGTLSYAGSKYTYGNYKINYNALYIGARGAYHFPVKNVKLDPYAGIGLGYVIVTVSDTYGYSNGASSSLGYSLFAGGRYYFATKAAVYAELGYASLSILNVGVSFRF